MPTPTTFGAWMELRPGLGRQPDPSFYAECLEEAALVEELGLAAVWGSEHHAVEDGHLSQQLPFLAAVAAGRLVLGLGNGYVEQEFDAFDTERPRRGQLMEEKLAYLRRAFREGVAADGPDGTDLPVGPRSPQPSGPPIYLGGMADRALYRVARLADGWFALAHFRYQRTADRYEVLRSALERA